jgi:hypothetical protein
MQMTSDNEENSLIEKQAVHKKAYHSPKLIGFGSLADLTHTNMNGPFSDNGTGMLSMQSMMVTS